MANNQPNQNDGNEPLSRAINSNYSFKLKAILGRANSQLNQNFGAMLQGSVLLFVALVALSLLLAVGFDVTSAEAITHSQRLLFQLVGVFLMAPLLTGLYMMGVSAARGNKLQGFDALAFIRHTFVLAIAQLLVSVVTQLGLALLIIPGVYLWVATVFTLPLVADTGMRPLSAMITSIRVVNRYLGYMFALMGIMLLLFATAIPTYGLSLIWVLPFYFSTIGMLYNDLFGGAQPPSGNTGTSTNTETHFDA